MKRASIGIGSHRRLALSEKRLPYLLTLPSLLTIFGVLIIPILYSLFLSVHNLVLSSRTYEFVGLKHYIAMFSDKSFLNSIWQTLVFTVLSVAAEMVLGVGVALVLNQEFKGRGFVRGLMILPWALPGVVNAIMWQWIFNANYGVFNALLTQLGVIDSYQVWLAKPTSAFICVWVANVWKETPYVVLLTIAALANISRDLYEAAAIDGCSSFQTLYKVIVPMLMPALVSCALFQFMWSCNDFMGPLLYVSTPGKYPMSLFVKLSMDGDTGFAWNKILALSLISILPQLIVFFCAQDQFVEGISAGAVKG